MINWPLARRAWSGVGVMGSIPVLVGSLVVFAVLVLVRFVSLMFTLNVPSETNKRWIKEASMNKHAVKVALGALTETAWALGITTWGGLLLSWPGGPTGLQSILGNARRH